VIQETLEKESSLDQRTQFLKLVRKWGDVNSDGLLEDDCLKFQIPEIEGFIGYKIKASNAVVFGDPVCSPKNAPLLALAFQEYCASKNLGVVYTIVSQEFSDWAVEKLSAVAVEFGEKYVLNPQKNPVNNKGSKAVLLRKKVKHATNEGIIVEEYVEQDSQIEKKIEAVAESWLNKRHGPQIYLSKITLFKDPYGKRWFYAKKGDQIFGLLLLNQLGSKEGWLLNNIMMTSDAPNGVSELLVITALKTLEKENCEYVLIGPVPGKQISRISGTGTIIAGIIRWAYKCVKTIFPLEGHTRFWEKFQPQSEGSFVIFPKKNVRISSVRALLKAYNVGKGK
jgi:lysylphosphatidylglycerol synthetase-like protein (DUF2156 family)